MKLRITTAIILGAALLSAVPALAGNRSLLTVGFGPQMGIARYQDISGNSHSDMISEMNLRVKMLRILGIDANYNIGGENSVGGGEVFASKYRVSALLYPIPTRYFSLYLSGGYGASSVGDMTSGTLTSKSYHAGGGMEIYAGKHFTITADVLVLVPDVNRIAVSHQPLQMDGTGRVPMEQIETPDVTDYLSVKNLQVNLGVKFFF